MSQPPRYSEASPPWALRDRVACLWRFRQGDEGAAPVRVLPDGYVDLIWNGDELFVAGPDTAAAMAQLEPGTVLTGVRLAPGVGAGLLGVPLHALTDQRVAVTDLWGRRGHALDRALRAGQEPAAALLALCEQAAPDRRMQRLFQHLASEEGARIARLATELGYSERSLRRHCMEAFGYGAKTLDRILRLQRFLRLAPRHPSLTAAALEAGYADAPHLVRDAQQLSGLNPRELVAGHGR